MERNDFLMMAEKAAFKAAKTINQHIDRKDYCADVARIDEALKYYDELVRIAAGDDKQARMLLKRYDEIRASKENGWKLRVGKVERLIFGDDAANQNDPRYMNVSAYKLTMRVCRKGFYISPEGVKIDLPTPEETSESTIFYDNPGVADGIAAIGETKIEVIKDDCIAVAERLVAAGEDPLLLNMASNRRPGGGVMKGSRAQEETIFRRSTAHMSLYPFHADSAQQFGFVRAKESYPMNRNTGGIYSGRIMFFRADAKDNYRFLEDPFSCAMVSVAAEINESRDAERLPSWMVRLQKDKIRTILRIGLLNGHRTFILGAFGCGAYGNPPEQMAILFREVFEEPEFKNKCEHIVFAILDDRNAHRAHNPRGNYAPFADVFHA